MIVDKHAALAAYPAAPGVCAACGAESEVRCDAEPTRAALIAASYLAEFRAELDLLRRADRLFRRFPGSGHPVKVAKERIAPGPTPWAADPAFERELRADPRLYDYLAGSSFHLPARLAFAAERVAELAAMAGAICPTCGTAGLRLEPDFFDRLL